MLAVVQILAFWAETDGMDLVGGGNAPDVGKYATAKALLPPRARRIEALVRKVATNRHLDPQHHAGAGAAAAATTEPDGQAIYSGGNFQGFASTKYQRLQQLERQNLLCGAIPAPVPANEPLP